MPPLDPKDGGIASRKLWLVIGIGLIMVGCWLLTGFVHTLQATFDTLVGGLLALAGLYITGNVSSRWVTAKSNAAVSFQGEVPGAPPAPVAPPGVPAPVPPAAPPVQPPAAPVKPVTEEEGS